MYLTKALLDFLTIKLREFDFSPNWAFNTSSNFSSKYSIGFLLIKAGVVNVISFISSWSKESKSIISLGLNLDISSKITPFSNSPSVAKKSPVEISVIASEHLFLSKSA